MCKASKGKYRGWEGMGWEWGAMRRGKGVSNLCTMRGVHEGAGDQMELGAGEQVVWGWAAAAVGRPRCWLRLPRAHAFLRCWQHFARPVLLLCLS